MKITRTITKYSYNFGEVKDMVVTPIAAVETYEKLGPRKIERLKKDNGFSDSVICYSITEAEEYREMSIEDFIAHSTIVEKPEKVDVNAANN